MKVLATLIAIAAVVALVYGRGLLENSAGSDEGSAALDPVVFEWLHPTPVPPSWSTLRLPNSPASLPVPTEWHEANGDPGTRTAELKSTDGDIDGYLNATPRQGEESLENWGEFRVDHNADEGDSEVTLEVSATGLRFPTGRGSCVIDSYRTETDNHYREIACIVAGPSATTVIVAAAPPDLWREEVTDLRRAVTSFTT